MKLIVDSGSTKTDWIALDEQQEVVLETQTQGLNPQVLSDQILEERIINNYDLYRLRREFTQIYFYGAGCGTRPPRELLKEVLTGIFPNAEILVREDTYAAVYASADIGKESIVCILGTGSNCSYFDGKNIEQRIDSLGFILMDDGSGNYFGRQLLRDFYFNKIPTDLAKIFNESFDLASENIKTNLYKKPNPNTYLAKFARFLIENKEAAYSQKLIKKGFDLFVKHQVLQFDDATKIPVHFIGSIAYYLKAELAEVLAENGLTLGKVLRKPIDGLVAFHKQQS
jgi:N-acetylglucosamine kinase-like BadF-type ATPase